MLEDEDDPMLDFSRGTLSPYHSESDDSDDCPLLQLEDEITQRRPEYNCYSRCLVRWPSLVILAVLAVVASCAAVSYKFHFPIDFDDPTKGFETRGTVIVRNDKTLSAIMRNYGRRLRRHAPGQGQGAPTHAAEGQGAPTHAPTASCSIDVQSSVKFVFSAHDGSTDLFSVRALRALCTVERQHFAQRTGAATCGVQSIASRLLSSVNASCGSITQTVVSAARDDLHDCAQFYQSRPGGVLSRPQCGNNTFVRDVLLYFSDKHFYSGALERRLRYTVVYVSQFNMDEISYYRRHLAAVTDATVKLVAVDFVNQESMKYSLFSDFLLSDMKFFGVAAVLVVITMLLYLRSVVITLATQLAAVFSFVLAYFAYFFICRMTFFPFINIIAVIIVIAVGADDVFVYYDAWQQAGRHHQGAARVSETFSHAVVAVAVTSITTSCAFFSNCVSSVTSIRCFGVFAGLAVIANLLLTVTWTPAVIVLRDKASRHLPDVSCCASVHRVYARLSGALYQTALPSLLRRLRFPFLVLFPVIGVGGFVIVFIAPKLHLPSTGSIQLFPTSNLIERWDSDLRLQFKVEVEVEQRQAADTSLVFVFGFRADDEGSWLTPHRDNDNVTADPAFHLTDPATQSRLSEFCHALSAQPFVTQPLDCSNTSTFGREVERDAGGRGLLIPFSSALPYPSSFSSMSAYYARLSAFSAAAAADGFVATVWQREAFELYDLQRAIVKGTFQSVGLSLGAALVVMLAATLNPLITLYALATISFAIASIVATIVLLGWTLNVIVSIVISLAVGLSIDFTLHYGVAYRLSVAGRAGAVGRVGEAVGRVGGAVSGSALTTFLTGLAVSPCSVLPYTRLGVFLMLVMTSSWLFSTFFFLSLCLVLPPDRWQWRVPWQRDPAARRHAPWQRAPVTPRRSPQQLDASRVTDRDDDVSLQSHSSHDSLLATF